MQENEIFRWSELSPVCLVRRVLRQLPAILMGGVVAVIWAWIITTSLYRPTYVSSATLAVSVGGSTYSSVLANLTVSNETAETFTQLFESNVFESLAVRELGLSQLPGELTATVLPDTNLLVLRAEADTPAGAFQTLELVLDNYDQISDQLFQNVILSELASPVVPTAPSNPLDQGRVLRLSVLGGWLWWPCWSCSWPWRRTPSRPGAPWSGSWISSSLASSATR